MTSTDRQRPDDDLHALLREANERLVLSSLRAHELAEEAEAARLEVTASEERFRSLVEASSSIVWRTAPDGQPLSIAGPPVPRSHTAPRWTELTGIPIEERTDWDWFEAVHPADQDRARATWRLAVAIGKPFRCELRLQKHGGGWHSMCARAVRLPLTGEWVGMMTDLSDRKALEDARERFIGILGHDLRNPLGALTMAIAHLAKSDMIGDRDQRVVKRMAFSAQRMANMVGDLLDLARGHLGGGIPVTPEDCDLGAVCEGVVDECEHTRPEHGILFSGTGDLRGRWDPGRIEQVVSNLVGNAVQHGEGPITVTASGDDGEHVVIEVTNQGPPIPAAVAAELFDAFGPRADPGSRGLGLGLYIVNEIVRGHHGTIDVVSRDGEGTTFTVRLPRRADA